MRPLPLPSPLQQILLVPRLLLADWWSHGVSSGQPPHLQLPHKHPPVSPSSTSAWVLSKAAQLGSRLGDHSHAWGWEPAGKPPAALPFMGTAQRPAHRSSEDCASAPHTDTACIHATLTALTVNTNRETVPRLTFSLAHCGTCVIIRPVITSQINSVQWYFGEI